MGSAQTPEYRRFLTRLIQAREDAGLKQADAARIFGQDQAWMSKVERGVRRLDVHDLPRCHAAVATPLVGLRRRSSRPAVHAREPIRPRATLVARTEHLREWLLHNSQLAGAGALSHPFPRVRPRPLGYAAELTPWRPTTTSVAPYFWEASIICLQRKITPSHMNVHTQVWKIIRKNNLRPSKKEAIP